MLGIQYKMQKRFDMQKWQKLELKVLMHLCRNAFFYKKRANKLLNKKNLTLKILVLELNNIIQNYFSSCEKSDEFLELTQFSENFIFSFEPTKVLFIRQNLRIKFCFIYCLPIKPLCK